MTKSIKVKVRYIAIIKMYIAASMWQSPPRHEPPSLATTFDNYGKLITFQIYIETTSI